MSRTFKYLFLIGLPPKCKAASGVLRIFLPAKTIPDISGACPQTVQYVSRPQKFPRIVPMFQIPVKSLPCHMKRITIKRNPPLYSAAVCLDINKPHPQVFADFRRLAAKKALASAKNSFSSFKRAIPFACSLFCCLSFCTSSVRLIAVSGV